MFPASALTVLLVREKELIHGNIQKHDDLIKGVEAEMLAPVFNIHNGSRSAIYKLGQIFLRPTFPFSFSLNFPTQGVKIKPFIILVHFYITLYYSTFRASPRERNIILCLVVFHFKNIFEKILQHSYFAICIQSRTANTPVKNRKHQKGNSTMKKIIAFALSTVMALSLAACGDNNTAGGKSAEIPDPFTECDTMEDAAKLVGFDVAAPDAIDSMDKSVIRVDTEGKLIEVIYGGEAEEDEKVTIRKAEGSEDISGDYTQYANSDTVTIGDKAVTMKGDGDQVNVATWANGDYAYSITSSSAMSKVSMTDLISVVDGNEPAAIGGDPDTWGPALDSDDTTGVEIPDPFVECASLDEAAKATGFSMMAPDTMDGYSERVIRVLASGDNDSMIEVIYRNDDEETENEIRIRKAVGNEDTSGDYTQYAESNTVTVGDIQVTMKGENGQVNLATWTNGDYTYSIGVYSKAGLSNTAMTDLVSAVQ